MTRHIEGLQAQLEQTQDPQTRVDLLNQLARHYLFIDPARMLEYALQAHAIASNGLQHVPSLARSLENIGLARLYMGQPEIALPLLQESLSLLEEGGDEALIAAALGPLGRCHSMMSDYPQALAIHIRQLRLAEKLSDSLQIIIACVGMGTVYFELGQNEQAITHFERSLALAREHQLLEWQLTSLNDLAEARTQHGDLEIALALALEAMQLAEKSQRQHVLAAVRCTLAKIYRHMGRRDEAMTLLQANHAVFEMSPELTNIMRQTYRLMGELAMDVGQWDTAVHHFNQALECARRMQNRIYEYDTLELLAQAYEAAGDFQKALSHFKAFHELKSEVFNDRADQRTKALEAAFNTQVARREANLLLAQNAELVVRVTERTRELEEGLVRERQLKQELELAAAAQAELASLKGQIITNVSHEFRTPLAVINTSVELLVDHYERLTPEKRGEIRKRIHDSIFYITDLLRDVMVVERTQAESLHPDPIRYRFGDFWKQLEQHVRRELSSPPHIHFEYDSADLTELTADFVMVKQIVFNLLSNALKYSPKGAPIHTRLTHNGSHWLLSVKDQGIGVPPDEAERIFELFYRGSNVETRRGLGLGMYIVRRFVTAMGGTVVAHSQGAGQGTTFEVRLPLHILPTE